MIRQGLQLAACMLAVVTCAAQIPEAAWTRPLGEPLANPGTTSTVGYIDDGIYQGAPVGGLGAGTFSRTYRGDFARWHIKAGVHKYESVPANQFALFEQSAGNPAGFSQVLMNGHPQNGTLSSWRWDYPVGAGNYAALYPKSWYEYRDPHFPAPVRVEQFSPLIAGNERESSYPIAVYRWHAENPTDRPVTVSILLSWANMSGWFRTYDRTFRGTLNQGSQNRMRLEKIDAATTMKGIVFDRVRASAQQHDWQGQFVIAANEQPGVELSYQTTFRADGNGSEVWNNFAQDGRLSNDSTTWVSAKEPLAGAIALRITLAPGEQRTVPMVIAWDFPVIEFGEGRRWLRRYTDFYGSNGNNAWAIARDGLAHAEQWSNAIDAWQAPYANDVTKPAWYRGMLFNELYALADGGTFWGRREDAPRGEKPSFAMLECYDYAYYGTLDVRFYGSLPLLKFWPEIDKQVLRSFAATVNATLDDLGLWVWKTDQTGKPVLHVRKRTGAVPHDLGVPEADPFFAVNEPGWQDTNDWKDLNPKFVLMVYRDYKLTGATDKAFLRETYPAVKAALEYLRQFDHGRGVPENSGYPDQTYDSWVVSGVSAYSGGLWLAALRAAEQIALELGESEQAAHYHAMLDTARKNYIDTLWNGQYFRYDGSGNYRDAIQADQLAGPWYARMLGLGDILPTTMLHTTMQTIYTHNVTQFAAGSMGAVNGMLPDGRVVDNEQAREVWAGTTESFAAMLHSEGLDDEAMHTLRGLYHVIYELKGFWFRTPEAWEIDGRFRAGMYMRPLGIWALEMTPVVH